MKIRNGEEAQKSGLNMTSMIDVVFLLLIFFVMTFKIVELEGDFSVRMPLAGSDSMTMDPTDLPLKLRLQADEDGKLTTMSLNEISLGTDFDQLRANVVQLIGTTAPAEGEDGPEIEIDTDYNLRYEYVIRSITAVSGYKDGNEVVKLIEKIKFAKPRR
ncbi:biopolymer transporter ExbD [Rhodopirellula sp.]|nr:biopolymer transporter ExbD [Rhodopirellula sp.]MDB4476758.1 biopolymer transporter ExbD [Rhodopirellula sp.]MDC0307291.1 biopolymer transporter ExbD [bacterium]MDC0326135.1 biopolymer transporter ExbD [bacterium]